MNIENPIAFSFIMQDDIYLLNKDKEQYSTVAVSEPVSILAEPEPEYAAAVADLVATAITAAEPMPVNFNYLGGHKKNFLVIVHYPEHDFMHEKHLAALESTLTRLGFSRDDVAIFNKAKYIDVEFAALATYFKPEKLLILGKGSLPTGIEAIELNKLKQLNSGPALFTFSFDEMMDSIENKKAFWEQMKQL
jgi:hypothetical protein